MADNEGPVIVDTGKKILTAVGFGLLALVIIYITWLAVQNIPASLKDIGATSTSTPIEGLSGGLGEQIVKIVVGIPNPPITWELLILHLAIFVILLFGIADVLEMFSALQTSTCWVIALGLGLIANVTGITPYLAGLFAIGSGIGAAGIAIIIVGAFAAAITLNLGIGGAVRKWRLARQMEVESMKSERGTGRVGSAIRGLKEIEKDLARGENS